MASSRRPQPLVGLAGVLLFCLCLTAQAQPDFLPQARAYLVESDGRVLWEKDADRPLPPASLTKLMTALLVHERGGLDEVATVTPAAAAETGSRIGLKAGDRLRVRDLLAAALIQSANDACHALADWLAGDEARFVKLMNRRAGELDLKQTRYTNAAATTAPATRPVRAILPGWPNAPCRRPSSRNWSRCPVTKSPLPTVRGASA